MAYEGWGDPENVGPFYDNSLAIFNEGLYVGTIKNWLADPEGGEVWKYVGFNVFLPLAANGD